MNTETKCASYMNRRALCGAIWLALAVFLMVFSRSALLMAFPHDAVLSGDYDGDGPGFSEIRRVQEQAVDERGEPVAEIAAWRAKKAELRTESTNGVLSVDALWVDGPTEAVWDLKEVSGSLPVFGDESVVALSRDAAEKLLGSTDIMGQTVACEGKKFTVACVFELPKGALAPAADPGRGLAILPASALPVDEKEKAPTAEGLDCLFQEGYTGDLGAALEGWLSKAGVAAPDRTENRMQTKALFAFAASLPQLLLSVLAALRLASESVRRVGAASARLPLLRTDRRIGTGRMVGMLTAGYFPAALIALLAVGVLLPFAHAARLPPACIPSRWSDLGFWPELLRGFMSNTAESALRAVPRQDLALKNLAALSCLAAFFALPAVWFSFRAFRQSAFSGRAALHSAMRWLIPAVCLFTPVAAWLALRIGLTPDTEGADLWPPVLFSVACSLNFSVLDAILRAAW